MFKYFSHNRWLIIIVLIGFLLRMAFYFVARNHYQDNLLPNIASDGYYQIAQYFSGSKEMPADSSSISVRTPGYPLLMAPFVATNALWLFSIIQIIVSSFIALPGYFVSLRLVPGNKKIAYGAAGALALEPFSIMLATQLITETFFVFFFLSLVLKLLSFLQTERKSYLKDILTIGALSGIGALIRPPLIYFPAVIVILIFYKFYQKDSGIFFWKKIISYSAIFLSIFFIIISPWMYRNYRVHGSWSLTSAGSNLGILALAPSVVALERNISYADAQKVVLDRIKLNEQPNVSISQQQKYNQVVLDIIKENPKGFALSILANNFQLWTHDGYLTVFQFLGIFLDYQTAKLSTPPLFTMLTHPLDIPWKALMSYLTRPIAIIVFSRIFWILLSMTALAGLCLNIKNRGLLSIYVFPLLLILAYFSVTSMILGLGITARVRQPVNAFVFILAGYALLSTKKALKRKI